MKNVNSKQEYKEFKKIGWILVALLIIFMSIMLLSCSRKVQLNVSGKYVWNDYDVICGDVIELRKDTIIFYEQRKCLKVGKRNEIDRGDIIFVKKKKLKIP